MKNKIQQKVAVKTKHITKRILGFPILITLSDLKSFTKNMKQDDIYSIRSEFQGDDWNR